MSLNLSVASTEYVRVAVSSDHDVTADVVKLAFIGGDGPPTDAQWLAATWDGTSARVLVGPGTGADITLLAGIYSVWVKLTDTPEVPVRRAGVLTIT